jgi:hypothetical protein
VRAPQAVFALTSKYKWGLSGTPLQNRVAELYSLIRFLRYVGAAGTGGWGMGRERGGWVGRAAGNRALERPCCRCTRPPG